VTPKPTHTSFDTRGIYIDSTRKITIMSANFDQFSMTMSDINASSSWTGPNIIFVIADIVFKYTLIGIFKFSKPGDVGGLCKFDSVMATYIPVYMPPTPKLIYYYDNSIADTVDIIKVYMLSSTLPYRYHIYHFQETYRGESDKSLTSMYPHTMEVTEQNVGDGLCIKKTVMIVDTYVKVRPEHLFRLTHTPNNHMSVDTVDEVDESDASDKVDTNVSNTYDTRQFIYYTNKHIYPDVGYTARFQLMGDSRVTLAIAMSGNSFYGKNAILFAPLDGVMFHRIDKNVYRATITGLHHYIELT
jgi:hypothetical protein